MRNPRASFELDVQSAIQIHYVTDKYAITATVPGKVGVLDLECEHDSHIDCSHKRIMEIPRGWDVCCYDTNMVTAGWDGVVRVWCLKTGSLVCDLVGHTDAVVRLTMASSCTFLSGSVDTTMRLWDPESASCKQVFSGHSKGIICMTVRDGMLASGSADCTAKIWSLADGNCLHSLDHAKDVVVIGFRDDGALLATGESEGRIKVWNTSDGTCIATCDGHTRIPRDIRSVCGNLVTTSADGTIRTWDWQDGSLIRVLDAHYMTVTGFVYTDDYLITGGLDGKINVWSRGKNELLFQLREEVSYVARVYGTRTLLVAFMHLSDRKALIQTWDLQGIRDNSSSVEHSTTTIRFPGWASLDSTAENAGPVERLACKL